MDYRLLLKKYMDQVIRCEGISFIGSASAGDTFTQKEIDELNEIEDRLYHKPSGGVPIPPPARIVIDGPFPSMGILLKLLNPFIWFWNNFKYMAHLDSYRYSDRYKPYDFSKDWGYF